MILIEGNREALYQWDVNQRIILTEIAAGTEVHFSDSHNTEEECPILYAYEENGQIYANIPNIFLQKNGIIYVYVYVKQEDKSYTSHYAEIIILARKKPADYIYTETEVKRWETIVDERVAKGLSGKVDKENGKGLSTNDFTDEFWNACVGAKTVIKNIHCSESPFTSEEDFNYCKDPGLYVWFYDEDYVTPLPSPGKPYVEQLSGACKLLIVEDKYRLNDEEYKEWYKNQYLIDFEAKTIKRRESSATTNYSIFDDFWGSSDEWSEWEVYAYLSDENFTTTLKNKINNTYSKAQIDKKLGDIELTLDELHNYAQALINGGV